MRHSYGNSVCVTPKQDAIWVAVSARAANSTIRNLTHAEMVLQVLHVQSELDATNER